METREKGKYEFSLDNRQVALIVSGLILVLALSFLLGTLFGRNLGRMADTGQPPAAVATADATTAESSDLAAMPAAGGTVAPATLAGGTADRENLIAGLQSMKPALTQAGATTPAPAPAPAAAAPAASAAYQPPAAPPAPLSAPIPVAPPTPKPAPKPTAPDPDASPASAPAPAGAYTIQIASAPSKAEAQVIVNELRSKKYDAYMLPVGLPSGTFYRVRVGHYSSLDQAEKARKILQTREGKYFDAWITQ